MPRRRLVGISATALVLTTMVIGPATADTGVVCRIADTRLTEISGMAPSIRHDDVLWLHNDSSGGPVIYALDSSNCDVLAVVEVQGMQARDIEGIASGTRSDGSPVLWIGDIGDNRDSWPQVSITEIDEPALTDATVRGTTYAFDYADGPVNAETLLANPREPELWIVSKSVADGAVWRLPSPPVDGMSATRVADAPALVTDGAFSRDGSRVVLRDYLRAIVYSGIPRGDRELVTLALPAQPQGEAVAWTADGRGLYLASERDDRLMRVELPEAAWADSARSPSPRPDPTVSPEPDGDATSEDRGLATVAAVIGAGLVIGVVVGLLRSGRQKVRGRHRASDKDREGDEQ